MALAVRPFGSPLSLETVAAEEVENACTSGEIEPDPRLVQPTVSSMDTSSKAAAVDRLLPTAKRVGLDQTPDLRHLPQEHIPGTGMRCERGRAPSTARAAEAPICPASERWKRHPGPSRALSGSTLLPWPKSAQNRANAQQWSRGRLRGLIYSLVQPSASHGLRIQGSTGCSRC